MLLSDWSLIEVRRKLNVKAWSLRTLKFTVLRQGLRQGIVNGLAQ